MADKLVTIASFRFLAEAEAARMHLEGAGVPAFLSDKEVVNIDWLLGNAIGYIKLQVPESQAEAAQAILEPVEEDWEPSPEEYSHPDDDAATEEENTSPAGQTNIMAAFRSLKRPIFWIILAPALIGLVVLALLPLGWLVGLLFEK